MPVLRPSKLDWRRALAEMALIFIGITLALLFDNWNQDRKERALERQLLAEVRSDLVETRVDVVSDIENSRQRLAYWRDMAATLAEDKPLDEAWVARIGETFDYSVLIPKTSGYRSLTSQGLGILSDAEVRKAITDFYELRLGRIALFERRTFPHFKEVYIPYVQRVTQVPREVLREAARDEAHLPAFVPRYELRDAEAVADDPMLPHLLFQMTYDTLLVLRHYEQSREDIDALIGLIDAQLAADGSMR